MRRWDLLLLVAIALVVAGVAAVYPPAGLIVAGLLVGAVWNWLAPVGGR